MMRPSRSAAAPPASLTSPKSCATKRQRKAAAAAPLGDVTNLLVLAETPTPSKPRRTACRSLPAPSDVSAVSSACSSSASAAPAPKPSAAASATPAPKPSSVASVTPARKPSSAACVTPAPKPCSAACVVTPAPAPKPSSAAVIQEERGVVKSPTISTVYRRTTETQGRWRNPAAANSKGKEPVAATARCPPLGKSARTNSRKKDTRPISASASCHEGKKKRSIASAPNLLEDLFEKQRAYFADFDAFELVEEDTNLLVIAETPTLSKPRRTARRSLPALSDVSAVSSACSSSASVTPVPKPSGAASVTPARKLSPAACVTPKPKPSYAACVVTPAPKPSSAAVLEEERSVLKSPTISTVHRRTTEAQGRWRRNPAAANSKGKEPVAATARLPPLGKSARTNSRKKDTRPISASAPSHEGKKKRSIASTPNLLEDLLEKQRAYFADIDAFELVEEEASESELE